MPGQAGEQTRCFIGREASPADPCRWHDPRHAVSGECDRVPWRQREWQQQAIGEVESATHKPTEQLLVRGTIGTETSRRCPRPSDAKARRDHGREREQGGHQDAPTTGRVRPGADRAELEKLPPAGESPNRCRARNPATSTRPSACRLQECRRPRSYSVQSLDQLWAA